MKSPYPSRKRDVPALKVGRYGVGSLLNQRNNVYADPLKLQSRAPVCGSLSTID